MTAPCVGMGELFFSTDPSDVALACSVCANCPGRAACAARGAGAEFGVWGGVPRAGGRPLKAACPQGHPYTDENTSVTRRPNGTIQARSCRACARVRSARKRSVVV